MGLLELYRKLLAEYDQVLSLSRMILFELETGGQEQNLNSLLQRKESTGRKIALLTEQIASFEVKRHPELDLRTLAAVKPLLKQIEKKANLLQDVERKIQNFVGRKGRQ